MLTPLCSVRTPALCKAFFLSWCVSYAHGSLGLRSCDISCYHLCYWHWPLLLCPTQLLLPLGSAPHLPYVRRWGRKCDYPNIWYQNFLYEGNSLGKNTWMSAWGRIWGQEVLDVGKATLSFYWLVREEGGSMQELRRREEEEGSCSCSL